MRGVQAAAVVVLASLALASCGEDEGFSDKKIADAIGAPRLVFGRFTILGLRAAVASGGRVMETSMLGKYGGVDHEDTSFAAVLAVSADGTIQVQTETAVRLRLDVQGYYSVDVDGTAPGGFVPLTGVRIADTRSGINVPQAPVASGAAINIPVTGVATGIPSDASAAIVNVTIVNTTTTGGALTAYPTGSARPSRRPVDPPRPSASIVPESSRRTASWRESSARRRFSKA